MAVPSEHNDYSSVFTNSLLPFIETDLAAAMDPDEIQREPTEPLAIIIATANHIANNPNRPDRSPLRARTSPPPPVLGPWLSDATTNPT